MSERVSERERFFRNNLHDGVVSGGPVTGVAWPYVSEAQGEKVGSLFPLQHMSDRPQVVRCHHRPDGQVRERSEGGRGREDHV